MGRVFKISPLSHAFLPRLWDLEKQEKQLDHYQQSSTSLEEWIDNARKRQDNLQMAKFTDIQILMDHLNQQKARYSFTLIGSPDYIYYYILLYYIFIFRLYLLLYHWIINKCFRKCTHMKVS